MKFLTPSVLLLQLLGTAPSALALTVDTTDPNSLKQASSTTAANMINFYNNRASKDIPGKLDGTWWEGGAMFMALIQYWHWTGDSTYNAAVNEGMIFQAGDHGDFFPSNWSNYLGNDDQAFWGMAALTAAELKYPDVPNAPSWLSLAQGVFNDQVARWDTTTCQGGLRWQIYPYQGGYTIKNAISNGGLFQISARLARFTGNQTYADWAQKIWDWSSTTPLLENSDWHIADTTSITADCKDHGDIQWTYNYGAYLMGASYMYNMTNAAPKWKTAIDGLLGTSFSTFFPSQYGSNTMSEIACETIKTCDRNQICFKGFLSSWLATTAQLVPYTEAEILPKLQASAVAAGKQCSGEGNTALCGIQWYNPTWDGTQGLEQQMAALNIFSSNLVAFQAGGSTSGSSSYTPPTKPAPVTASSGGNSSSNPNAGSASTSNFTPPPKAITTGDRAGAGIVTVIFAGGWLGMIAWMVTGA